MKYFKYTLFLLILFLSVFVNAQEVSFVGITKEAGEFGGGSIFRIDQNGENYEDLISFGNMIRNPNNNSLIEASDSMFYGFSKCGDANIIYRYNPILDTIEIEKVIDENPEGKFMDASNGIFYGSSRCDFISYNPENKEYTNHGSISDNCGGIQGKLLEATNGKIYGVTQKGGIYSDGILFVFDPEIQEFEILINFNGWGNGQEPIGGLMQASNGKIYGTTSKGGDYNEGVLFEYDIENNMLTKKVHFNNDFSYFAMGNLIEVSNGDLYGLTGYEIYSYNIYTEEFTVLYDTYILGGSYKVLNYSMINAFNGSLYINAYRDRNNNENDEWSILSYNIAENDITVLAEGDPKISNNFSNILLADNGKLYATGIRSWYYEEGALFEFDPQNATFLLKDIFNVYNYGNIGMGNILKMSNGKIIGKTLKGGSIDYGTIFEMDPYTKEYYKIIDNDYNYQTRYYYWMETSSGKVFGVGTFSPSYYNPTDEIVEYDPVEKILIRRYLFDSHDEPPFDGRDVSGGMIEADNGKLYGVTLEGGGWDLGIMYEFDPETYEYNKIFDFDQWVYGYHPYGPIVKTSSGKLLVITDNKMFEYDPLSNQFSASGQWTIPVTNLIELSSNGKVYWIGKTSNNSNSKLYEYDVDNREYPIKLTINVSSSSNRSMIEGSDGNLYFALDRSKIYKYDPNTESVSEFTGYIDLTYQGGIIELCNPTEINIEVTELPDIVQACAIEEPNIPNAIDNCGNIIKGISSVEFPISAIDTTIVTWSYISFGGDTLTQTQNFIVYDSIAPTATEPDTLFVACSANFPDPNPLIVDAFDNCMETPIVEWVKDSTDGNLNPETIYRTYSVSDEAENQVFVQQVIIIENEEPQTNVILESPSELNSSQEFTTTLRIENVENLASFEIEMSFDTSVLIANSIVLEDYLGSTGREIFPVEETIDNVNGAINYAVLTLDDTPEGPSGNGDLLNINWNVKSDLQEEQQTIINIENSQFAQPDGSDICVANESQEINILACLPQDIDCDCDVDIIDVTTAAYHYGTEIGDELYNPLYDLDNDFDIDIIDLTMISFNYGWSCNGKKSSSMMVFNVNENQSVKLIQRESFMDNSIKELILSVEDIYQFGAYELRFRFDPDKIEIISVEESALLEQSGRKTIQVLSEVDKIEGLVKIAYTSLGNKKDGVNGNGELLKIRYKKLSNSLEADFELINGQLARIDAQKIPFKSRYYKSNDQSDYFEIIPNPNNGEFVINYKLESKGKYSISVITPTGHEMILLKPVQKQRGNYNLHISDMNLAPGIYLIKLRNEHNELYTKKMIVQ